MNGVTDSVAPSTGAPTTPEAIALTCTTHVLSLRAGGAGSAEISLKSSLPASPAFSSPTTNVSARVSVAQLMTSPSAGPEPPPPQAASTSVEARTVRMYRVYPSYERLVTPDRLT